MSHHFLTHRFLRVITVISFAAAVCFSQDVKVKGIVKDSSGKAIAGAWVELEIKKIKTKTDAEGKFDLGNPVGVNSTVNAVLNTMSAYLKDGVLFLDILKRGPVEITMYTLNGQVVHTVKKIVDKGTHSIPAAHKAIGVYLYRIKTGDNEMMLKSYSIGGISAGSSINRSGIAATAEKDSRAPEHKDVLIVKAKGFVDYDIGVWNYDTSYNDIKMLVCEDTVVDADGNVYQAVKIGNQIWATSSLKTTKFNDGTEIPKLQEGSKWSFPCSPSQHKSWSKEEWDKKAGWCDQEADKDKIGTKWGKLYNWYAARHPKLAPKGWHVPTQEEFYDLRTYLVRNGYNWDGTKYPDWDVRKIDKHVSAADMAKNKTSKSVASRTYCREIPHYRGTPGNSGNDIRTNNRSGFNCKPLGSRWCDGSFHSFESSCYLWSTTESDEEIAQKPQGYLISFHGTQNFFGTNDHETRTGWQIRILKDK